MRSHPKQSVLLIMALASMAMITSGAFGQTTAPLLDTARDYEEGNDAWADADLTPNATQSWTTGRDGGKSIQIEPFVMYDSGATSFSSSARSLIQSRFAARRAWRGQLPGSAMENLVPPSRRMPPKASVRTSKPTPKHPWPLMPCGSRPIACTRPQISREA